MLLLTNGISALSKSNLTEKEIDFIEERVGSHDSFFMILREQFCSLFDVKERKRGKKTVALWKECLRYYPETDEFFVTDYLLFCRLYGWRTFFDAVDCRNSTYFRYYGGFQNEDLPNNCMIYSSKNNGMVFRDLWKARNVWCNAFSFEEYKAWIKRYLPYFDTSDHRIMNLSPWHLIKTYKENLPNSELLFKAGFVPLGMSKRICSLKGANLKKVLSFIKQNKKECNMINGFTVPEIIARATKGLTNEQYELSRKISKVRGSAKRYGLSKIVDPNETYKYLRKHGIAEYHFEERRASSEIDEYMRYLQTAIALGFDVNRGLLYPRDLEESMNNIFRIEREREEAARQAELEERRKEKIKIAPKVAELAEKLKQEDYGNGVVIKPLSNYQEFIDMGNYFNNCVGRCGYYERMAKGKSYICIVYYNNVPTECCEVDMKTNDILQEYGLNNKKVEEPTFNLLHPHLIQYAQSRACIA